MVDRAIRLAGLVPLIAGLGPFKKKLCLILFFTGKRANGQRAQPKKLRCIFEIVFRIIYI